MGAAASVMRYTVATVREAVRRDLLGDAACDWLTLGAGLPAGTRRLVLSDVDGVITRGEGQAIDIDILQRLAAINRAARVDPHVPAITLCTGRQAPYVELMAQLTGVFLPCIFEHGAGLFFPAAFRYEFLAQLGPDYAARLARLRADLDEPVLRSGQAFVQPGKEATMTLYPLSGMPVAELAVLAEAAVARVAPDFGVARNVLGVEIRPVGIDKATGARRIAELLRLSPAEMAGMGDSDPDVAFLSYVGLSAAPSNAAAAVRQAVSYVAKGAFGEGLLEFVTRVEHENRAHQS